MQPSKPHRTLRESDRFKAECKAIEPDAKRMDEILHAITFLLSHDPTCGSETDVRGILAAPTHGWPDAPALVIYYSYDDEYVDLLSVTRADEQGLEDDGEPVED